MSPIIIGIIWGVLVTHNVEKTDLYKCKAEKNQESCAKIELKK